ncbi:efflux RND transporter periplasmic adaptor subunit [Herbaspirillum sp. alder98]|uniref:efflux RND transporter periplasmic adaptor subunit n=1 Tax=Herbaspirillum sp. alder98 TaxID=2913096 RepID=UPI001CD8B594|nr:HlyD family efflux transporter periplasmic adaptor subunit [Herbaspirillum sp. alder98]MCA1325160.1 HlyD family efflux transporter periplasmic adaptor subunit [Herbaspirillum sp. alder98]
MSEQATAAAPGRHPLLVLLDLGRRARVARSRAELNFLMVNDSHALAPYRQAALWLADRGVDTLSGVVEPEANAPYALWLDQVCRCLAGSQPQALAVGPYTLPPVLAGQWSQWLPPYGLWLPFDGGGLLLAADTPWDEERIALFKEWGDTWHYAWTRQQTSASPWSWRRLGHALKQVSMPDPAKPWWRQRRLLAAALVVLALLCPVRLSVLAPGELVPANPALIRAPLDGIIAQFQVQPNEAVKAGQPLFNFDEAPIATRLEIATQGLATAQAEYRQYAQQALSDPKSKMQLANLGGKIEEKQAEADFAQDQFQRSRVVAPQAGIALFDDPSEWIGKPVQTGERIMRIATPGEVEVEAWLPMGDAIPLADEAEVKLYLASSPLSAVQAWLRYVAHDAVPRPDGSYAYRVRARLAARSEWRIGLKGTAKLSGPWVPLVYWMLRRPLAVIREHVGL